MKDKIINLLLPFSWLLILLFCLFLFSTTSHAEETINPLPYYVNYYYSDYFHLTSTQLDLITSYTGQSDYNIFWFGEVSESNTNYTFNLFCYQVGQTGSVALKSGADLTTDVDYGMFDMDNDYVVLSQPGGSMVKKIIRINKQSGEWSFLSTTMPTVRSSALLHLSTKEINQFGFTPGVPFIFQGSTPMIWGGDPNQIIFFNGSPVPPTPEDDNITDNPEKPDWDDYTVDFTTGKPSFDPDSPFDSLFSLWSWFINKLGDALTGGWNFIVDSINWALQTLLNNLRSLFNNVLEDVNDFADMVEDNVQNIWADLQYLVEPFDYNEVNTALTSTSFYALKTSFTSLFTTFDGAFDIAEPDTFTIIINVQNIDILYNFGCTSPVTINLGANFLPIRSALRTFLWVLVAFGSVFVVEHGLSSWLRGERNT